jgi:adenylate cyclase class 1
VSREARTPIRLGKPGEEIGKRDLQTVVRRFRALHERRLQRMLGMLPPRQGEFITLLPLLFQINHPLLPGYISAEAPAGIAGFELRPEALRVAQKLAKAFAYKPLPKPRLPIFGLYVMGSFGSIAYSKASDLDIWICHAPYLEPGELDILGEKVRAVEKWAATLGLEMHTFFIEAERFRQGVGSPLSRESAGSIQHHLLLEEFYRSGLHLAGRVPLWWVVPPEQENEYEAYVEHLQSRHFISDLDFIDFGGLGSLSSSEFLAASLWHLYKAIASPHKSLLKLLLMESYASEYPFMDWVSVRLKQALYNGEDDLVHTDPYVLMYRKVEEHLLRRDESDRLELARRSFYLKAYEWLSQEANRDSEQALYDLMERWGWGRDRLRTLDVHLSRRLHQAIEERKEIARGLTQSYQAIRLFAGSRLRGSSFENQELMLLGRMLYAALEKKPGKVDCFALDHDCEIEEYEFSLRAVSLADGTRGWNLYVGGLRKERQPLQEPVKKTRYLLEILAWMVANGLYGGKSPCQMDVGSAEITNREVTQILKTLAQWLHTGKPEGESLDAYMGMSRVDSAILFLNLGREAAILQATASNKSLPGSTDPLSFGIARSSLVFNLELVTRTSWHEMLVNRHEGLDGLFESLCDLYNKSGGPYSRLALTCHCQAALHGAAIAQRVQQIYAEITRFFADPRHSPRHVLRGKESFYVLTRRDSALGFHKLPNMGALLEEMARPVPVFSPILFDATAFESSSLPVICDFNRDAMVQVFVVAERQHCDLFILDERGALYHQHRPLAPVAQIINPIAVFLEAVQQRYVLQVSYGFEYHQLSRDSRGRYLVERAPHATRLLAHRMDVRVIGQELASGQIAYTVYCNDVEFSSMEEGGEVFRRAAAYILEQRRAGAPYPVYITDIDVPLTALGAESPSQLQTIHFLRYKDEIEARLNAGDVDRKIPVSA